MTSWVCRLFARPRPECCRTFALHLDELDGRALPALLSGLGGVVSALPLSLPAEVVSASPADTTAARQPTGITTPGLPLVSSLLGTVDAVVAPVTSLVAGLPLAPVVTGVVGTLDSVVNSVEAVASGLPVVSALLGSSEQPLLSVALDVPLVSGLLGTTDVQVGVGPISVTVSAGSGGSGTSVGIGVTLPGLGGGSIGVTTPPVTVHPGTGSMPTLPVTGGAGTVPVQPVAPAPQVPSPQFVPALAGAPAGAASGTLQFAGAGTAAPGQGEAFFSPISAGVAAPAPDAFPPEAAELPVTPAAVESAATLNGTGTLAASAAASAGVLPGGQAATPVPPVGTALGAPAVPEEATPLPLDWGVDVGEFLDRFLPFDPAAVRSQVTDLLAALGDALPDSDTLLTWTEIGYAAGAAAAVYAVSRKRKKKARTRVAQQVSVRLGDFDGPLV